MSKQGTYILSLEASDIYSHMNREKELDYDYVGMIPFSLELIKLKQEGLSVFKVKTSDKEMSNDLINVKFKQKVKSATFLIGHINKKIKKIEYEAMSGELKKEKTDKLVDYKKKLEQFVGELKGNENTPQWQEVNNTDLRKMLYESGFTVTHADGTQVKYVVYKRSSSKSRKGECLFIREELYYTMIKWSRLELDFSKLEKLDYPSLLAYESLVGSSLEGTIKINAKNILLVEDVYSEFEKVCNVVEKNGDYLQSNPNLHMIKNNLFDGESLLESCYFEEGQSMKLLRNHMFKSAAFNTNIQLFLQKECPKDIDFDDWYIEDMFNNPVKASDVHLITTPSSLKALKFSSVVGSEKAMYEHWKGVVKDNNNLWGICKHEKKSKRGIDKEGNTLQQLSYQMINSLPAKYSDIQKLLKHEKWYIDKLKNDDKVFMEHIKGEATTINSNRMMVDLLERNCEFVYTEFFKRYRKKQINKYVNHMRQGKVRLVGDYAVMLGNPKELLYHAIGKFEIDNPELELKGNEVYTTLHDFGKELVGFRNPHTAQANVLVVKNKGSDFINAYFNLTDNIVVVNTVEFPLPDILSGSDFDSDTLLVLDNDCLLELSKKCFGKYPVVINNVNSKPKKYSLNKYDMYQIDNQLQDSQKLIGEVTNTGQHLLSTYWDNRANGELEGLKDVLKKIDIMIVLSGISIDLAKKLYDIDIKGEIARINNSITYKKEEKKLKKENGKLHKRLVEVKPKFFKYVSQSETIVNRISHFKCPMDYLISALDKLPDAEVRCEVDFKDLLVVKDKRNGNRKQQQKILKYVRDMDQKIKSIYSKDTNEDEKFRMMDNIFKYYEFYISKLEVKEDTMYAILSKIMREYSNIAVRLMNVLYKTQKKVFLNAFVE
ncbi:MAG: hypothetical protein LPK00_13160 [Bacillaceae bacterium]|nr:hypothetical protein [Bacillaceae bacterium]